MSTYIFTTVPIPQRAEWPDVVVALFTVALFFVAWWQLGKIKKTGIADFAHRLNADFYTKHSLKIQKQIEAGNFKFHVVGSAAEFRDDSGQVLFTDTELDHHVLGPLEAVGIFEKRQLLDLEFAYDLFGSAIIDIMQSAEIERYIEWAVKRPNCSDLYSCLRFLTRECRGYTRAKEKGRWATLLWRIRFSIISRTERR
jgi:hypothetical protein